MIKWIKWINTYSGFFSFIVSFLSFLVSLILAFITYWYARQTKKQTNYAHRTLEEQNEKIRSAALNYSYLINAELTMHQSVFINYLYFKKYNRLPFTKDIILKNLSYKTWEAIRGSVPEYYSNDLMQELVGYYTGAEFIVTNNKLNKEQQIKSVKGQLVSMYKCIDLIESEFDIELRREETIKIDGHEIGVNKENGELIIVK